MGYQPSLDFGDYKTTFDFKHVSGRDDRTGKCNSVQFRLVTRWKNDSNDILSYIGEQSFKFIGEIALLTSEELTSIVKECYSQYASEFKKQNPKPKGHLYLSYPPDEHINAILQDLKASS